VLCIIRIAQMNATQKIYTFAQLLFICAQSSLNRQSLYA
jgi:hypothetical protein